MNLSITNAAHAYGFDDFSTLGGQINYGTVLDISYSVDPATIKVGQSFGASVTFSNGYVESMSAYLSYNSVVITGVGLARTDTGQSMFSISGSLVVNANNLDSLFSSSVVANLLAGNDYIAGNDYNNILEGYGGNDVLNGGGGTDTAVLRGLRSQYIVTKGSNGLPSSVSGPDGTDSMVSIERLKFNDVTVAYDTAGAAGQAYRLYQAAFSRTPDQVGLGNHVRGLDSGISLNQIANVFLNSAEFTVKYGAAPSNNAFVTQLYSNVLHRAPDAGGLAGWVGGLDHGTVSRADVLVGFSESAENQAALIGTISQGIVFTG